MLLLEQPRSGGPHPSQQAPPKVSCCLQELFGAHSAWFAQRGCALQGKRTFSTWPRVTASRGNALFAQSLLINSGLSSQTLHLLLKGEN